MNDGGPAFPTNQGVTFKGMCLRDYFAAAAIQGRLVATYSAANPLERFVTPNAVAQEAWLIADAMLKQRQENT